MDNFTASALVKLTNQEGGFSFNPITKNLNPTDGYMVSKKGFEKTVPFVLFNEDNLENFQYKNHSHIDHNTFIGAWVEDQKVYMDLSVHVQDLEMAILLGINNGQKAIYDCANNRSIYLPEVQRSGTMTQQQTYLNIKVRELLNQYK